MTSIDNISNVVITLIRAGAVFRAAFCCFRMITADEEALQYKKRLRNVIVFYVIAEMAWVIKGIAMYYFA